MITVRPPSIAFALVAAFSLCQTISGAPALPAEWPRVIFRDGVTNTIYQPQLEWWDYFTLKASSAVAIQPKGAPQPTFGTIDFQARTHVDRAQRTVLLEELQITKAEFPSAGAQAAAYLATLRSLVPKEVRELSLDRAEASLAILQARKMGSGQPLRNDPPAIIFSIGPAMLVLIDGQAVYRPVEKTDLDRVFNTRALILRDKSGNHYLHLFDGYVEASSLNGPWSVAKKVPGDVKKAEKAAVEAKQVDLLAGQENPKTKKKPSLKTEAIPQLHVAIVPTELIVTTGEPLWAPLPPTQLLYVTNTTAHIFKELNDQKTYVLISGRWFRSASFSGPWEYVSGADLPKDFANIPDDSEAENVKASVPGTRQAREAAIANSIPNSVKVDRKKTQLSPPIQYDGSPQIKPIDGTTLQYVVNCATPVIQVDTNAWFACQNGVWFVATSVNGPWEVATSVPPGIYSIPPSSPIHYVVYARIYSYDADFVWIGITPGYYGTMINADGVVVYGTGYPYPAYVGSTVYVAYPVTYGYGSSPCWTPWAGWTYGFAVGWAMYADWYWWYGCPCAPYWGPYWGWCYGAYYNAYGGITAWGPYGWAGTSGYIYTQHGAWSGVSRVAAGYNAWTGNEWAAQYGRAYNSTTGTRVAGQRGAVHNVYTGNYAYGGRGVAYNPNSGMVAAGGKVTWGNDASGNQGTAGRGTIYNPNTGNATHIGGIKGENGGIVNINGHVIAGKDGNYYRPDGSGGWDQITRPPAGATTLSSGGSGERYRDPGGDTWNHVRPSAADQQRFDSLNSEFGARQLGSQRQQSFQTHQPSFRGSGGFSGGGGFRGGGGGRRR